MSALLERASSRKPSRQPIRKPWSAWSNGDDRVRVQINELGMAKAFAKISGVTRTAHSVMGAFAAIYLTKNSREWVENWMKGHNQSTEVKAQCRPFTADNTVAQTNP
jgi:hypothetical protein